jgi:YVTN family beta-propeller protein
MGDYRFRVLAAGAAALLVVSGLAALGTASASATVTSTSTYPSESHFDLPIAPTQLVASPDGSRIYAATDSPTVLVIDTATKTVIRSIVLPEEITHLTLTSSGALDAVSLDANEKTTARAVYEIDPSTGSFIATALPSGFTPVTFAVTPDGGTAVMAEGVMDGTTLVRSTEAVVVHPHAGSLGPVTTLTGMVFPEYLAITPDGSQYFTVSRFDTTTNAHSGFAAVDASSGEALASFPLTDGRAASGMILSPDGRRVFVSEVIGTNGPAPVVVIDAQSDAPIQTIGVATGSVMGMEVSGDGSSIIGYADDTYVVIDPTSLAVRSLSEGGTTLPVVVPGTSRVYGIFGGEVDTKTGKLIRAASTRSSYDASNAVILPGDHDLFAIGSSVDNAPGAIEHLDLAMASHPIFTSRLFGSDRYATAEQLATTSSDIRGSTWSYSLYIVGGEEFQDSLSLIPASARERGSVLLTPPNTLPNVDIAFIKRYPLSRVILVGGTASVSQGIRDEVKSLTHGRVPIARLSGPDRYATSRAVVASSYGTRLGHVWIATGRDYPDALAAQSAAGMKNEPLLLVDGSAPALDAATAAFLRREGAKSFTIVGAESGVSSGVASGLATLGPVTRISGSDRYETSKLVDDAVFPKSQSEFVLTSGTSWAGSMAAEQLASVYHAPLALVEPNCVPDDLAEELNGRQNLQLDLIGGVPALSEDVEHLGTC